EYSLWGPVGTSDTPTTVNVRLPLLADNATFEPTCTCRAASERGASATSVDVSGIRPSVTTVGMGFCRSGPTQIEIEDLPSGPVATAVRASSMPVTDGCCCNAAMTFDDDPK